ncbi:MAG: type 1 glutamine amidotransferase domain-containing protein [Vulcanimicrobiota bacterium]
MKNKSVAVFVEKMYEDIELWYPYYRMKEEGARVTLIGPEKNETYTGKHGMKAQSDISIDEAKTSDYDLLIVPGGYSPDFMRRNKKMVRFVKDMHEQGKHVAAICHGAWMLASADILKNKKVTSFFSIQDDLKHAGAQWVDQSFVSDNRILTSRFPQDLPDFCRGIIEAATRQPAGV